MRQARWGMALCIVVLLSAVPQAGAQMPAMSFDGDGPVTVKSGGTAAITLFNNTSDDLAVTMDAVDDKGAETGAISIDSRSTAVLPGGVASFTVTSGGTNTQLKGFLIATGRPSSGTAVVVARRAFKVGAGVVLDPLVAKWTTTSYRGGLFGAIMRNVVIPIKDVTTCPSDPQIFVAGGVANPKGGASTVMAMCTSEGVDSGRVGVILSFPELSRPGDYVGMIDLLPTDDKRGAVELTVRRTDRVLLPALVLAMGIALALGVGRWVGRGNALAIDEEDMLRLLADADDAEREFLDQAGHASWKGCTYEPDLRNQVTAVIDGLRSASHKLSKLAADDPERVKIMAPRVDITKLVTLWPDLPRRLGELSTAIEGVQRAAGTARDAAVDPPEPAFLQWAQPLLTGRTLTVTEALTYAGSIDSAATMAEAWPVQLEHLTKLGKRSERIKKAILDRLIPESDLETLAKADRTLSEARTELWTATDAAQLEKFKTAEDIDNARSDLDSLNHYVGRTLARAGTETADIIEAVVVSGPSALRRRLDEPTPTQRAADLANRRRVRNLAVLAVLAGVTLWTGLTALYFDKAFGTFRDYGNVLLWGFGAQVALEGIAAGVDRLSTVKPVVR